MEGLALVIALTLLQAQPGPAAEVRSLGRQLMIQTKEDLATYEAAIARGGANQLDRLLKELTLVVLNANPSADPEVLQAELRAVYDPWVPSEYTSRAPEVFRVSLRDQPVMIVTWRTRMGGAGAPRSHVQILAYEKAGSGWRFTAETGEFLHDHGLFVVPVLSLRATEAWLVSYGVRTGSSRVDLTVALLAFDGNQFRTRWMYQDLAGGSVRVLPSGLRLEYRAYYAAGPNFIEVIEDLTFTPSGLAVKSRRIK